MYLVSSCLLGINCRYNGTSSVEEKLMDLIKKGEVIAVCPELLGKLPIPRESCERVKDKILGKSGKDYTNEFEIGAEKTLEICKLLNIDTAILQSRSPSCGCGKIYDGTFSGKLISGDGIVTELLQKNGIKVYTEENYYEDIK